MSSIVNPPLPPVDSDQIPSRRFIAVLGVTLVTWATLLLYVLIKVWPPEPERGGAPIYFFSKIGLLRFELTSGSMDQRLIFLVIIVGALGSFIHAATSFADYVGNRKFKLSWTWWYLLRPFVGAALALALYFVIRAGLLAGDGNATASISRFGVATLAALSGLFSKQATDKLEEVFTTFFKPGPGKGDAKRGDKLDALTITGFMPTRGPVKTAVKITGTGFVENASVTFGNVKAEAVVENATSIKAIAPDHAPGKVAVAVKNPDGKEVTALAQFTYTIDTTGAGSAPTITGFTPPDAPQSGGTEVKITGTGFVNKATVKFGEVDAVLVVVESPTVIKATTPKHDPGAVDVIVTNPDGKQATAKFTFVP